VLRGHRPRNARALALAAALIATLAPAQAARAEGANVTHVQNIPHTERRAANQTNQATDFELATYNVGGVERRYAFAGSYYDGIDVIDVTTPGQETKVAGYDCGVGQGDVQLFERDGRRYLAYAQDDGYTQYDSDCVKQAKALGFNHNSDNGGTYILDVTDPTAIRLVSFVEIGGTDTLTDPGWGSHNTTIHPSGRYLYNSNADLMTSAFPVVEIVDLNDLQHPKVVNELALETFPGLGTEPHDISFSPDGNRGYVAALSHGEILDTSDPANPRTIGVVHDPAVNVWHQMEAVTMGERTFLIAEDEFAGAEGTAECPSGAVHVYDITDVANPTKVGMFQIDTIGPAPGNDPAVRYVARCTAHVFQIDHNSKVMTMGWYNAGVRILDLSQLEGYQVGDVGTGGIKQLGWFRFDNSDTWAAKAFSADRSGFTFYGNDKRRGFDVYRYQPQAGAQVSAGRWFTAAQSEALAARSRKPTRADLVGLCFLAA
jgi:hypothetical protein